MVAKLLGVRLNAAYEFIRATDSLDLLDNSYYEYGAEVFLSNSATIAAMGIEAT